MLLVACNKLLVARNMLPRNSNFLFLIFTVAPVLFSVIGAIQMRYDDDDDDDVARNLLPATCCSSAQLVAAQHVALV